MLFHKARVKPRLQGRDCCVQRVSLLARVAGSHLQGHPFLLGEAIAGSRLLRILPLLPARSGCIPAAWAREMGLILRPPSRGQGRACQRTLGLEELCIWGGRSHERALRGEHAAAASWRGAAAMLRPGGTGGAASSSSSSCSSSSPQRAVGPCVSAGRGGQPSPLLSDGPRPRAVPAPCILLAMPPGSSNKGGG